MALISAATIITSLSLFHITLAFFFLTSPSVVAEQTLVFIIGESMQLPHTRAFDSTSPALAFLSATLLYIGVTDLVSVSLPTEVSQWHWGNQAPVRFLLTAGLAIYSYAFSDSSPLYASKPYSPSSWGGDGLKNRVLFTWAFVEMITWFWVFTTLREERREFAIKLQQKMAAENDML